MIVSYSPTILVPIDGAPVLKPIPDSGGFQRVINTRALIVKSASEPQFFLHVYDGWLMALSLDGPWSQPFIAPSGIDAVAQRIAATGVVDLLDGGPRANPKPSLAKSIPAIRVTQAPAELIAFNGQPEFVPIVGTRLSVGRQHVGRRPARYRGQCVLRAARRPLVSFRRPDRPLDVRCERRAAAGLRANSADVARRRRVADGRGHAAGARSGDRELDSADRDGAAQERPDVHAELRRRAAVRARSPEHRSPTRAMRRCR